MLIPVRCFTCGKPVGGLWMKFKERTEKGENKAKVMNELGVERYCCRRMILTHVDLLHESAQYE